MKPEKWKAPTKKFTLIGEEKDCWRNYYRGIKDEEFYEESGGGLTLSGGEIFAQFEFAKAFKNQLRTLHIRTAIETTAFVDMKIVD